jgi:GAF domain-containing protein/anti-sigma regulatory factor (Ser/Thr protein kinase)
MIRRVEPVAEPQPPEVDSTARTLAAVARVTDVALAYLGLEELLEQLLQRVADILETDTVAILLLDDDGRVLRARAAHGIEEEVQQGVQIPFGKGFAGRVAAERRPIAIPDLDAADVVNPILREKGIRSLLGVPLLVEGRVTGVLHVGTLVPRTFTTEDEHLLQLAADRAAIGIDRAQLYDRERAARAEAEESMRTLRGLQRITDAALAYLGLEDLLEQLLQRVADILETDTVAILLLDDDGRVLRARAAHGIEEEVEQGVRIPFGKGFAGRVAAERRPIAIPDLDAADVVNPILREKGIRSLLGVPLLVEGRVTGVLHVGTLVPRTFTTEDEHLLQLAADRAAIGIERAQLYEQRRMVESLQRVLLPVHLPEIPGLEIAARYRPAARGTRVGGDWYDVFMLPGGRVALAIGDVVGTGVAAAALMAQLRTALRAYAFDGHEPAAVVDRMNRLLAGVEHPTMTTVAYLVIDPEAETLRVVSAGHVPPLLVTPDGEARLLPVEGDLPLGVSRSAAYHEHEFPLRTGSRIVMVTDGAVEVPGEPLDAGLERLRELALRTPDGEQLCEAIAQGGVASRTRDDDIAVVSARLAPLPDALRASLPADANALAPMRHLLRRWLRRWGADEDEVYDITVAVQEACANAVEHAYAPGPAAFDLDAEHDQGTIIATITDRGGWRDPRGIHRGRGLPLMEALMDAVAVHRDETGTRVTLSRVLRAEAAG